MRKILILVLALVFLLGLAACSGKAPASDASLTVMDAAGREVQLPGPPQRVVITGRANFMLSNAAYLFPAAPERILGLTRSTQAASAFVSLIDPAAQDKTLFTSDSSPEEVAAAQPDLVLLKSSVCESLGGTLTQLGIPVVCLDFETPAQYQRDLAILGQLFNDPARAQEVWGYYQAILDRAAQATGGLTDAQKPRVLLLQYTDTGGEVAFKVPPASWIQTQMVELGGGTPIWKEAAQGGGWAVVNLEQIAAWNPNQIYIINYFGSPQEVVLRLENDPQWAALAAVQTEQFYAFPGDFYSWDQPDPRWGLGLLWLAQHIQPEAFADVDMQAEVYRFFETFYGLERAVIEAEILPKLHGLVLP